MTGRFLIMLVVLTAVVATRQPVVASAQDRAAPEPVKSTWVSRKTVTLSRSITPSALLHRMAFGEPRASLTPSIELNTHPVRRALPDPFRFCLPPPRIA